MTTQKPSIAEITQQIYELLKPLDSQERARIILAAQTLLGDGGQVPLIPSPTPPIIGGSPSHPGKGSPNLQDIRSFFDHKAPENKGEELAVAARFREMRNEGSTHTKDELETAIKAARRNFDSRNFSRDIDNATRKGLFNKGKDHTLAYYGQEYVDALPDREAIQNLRKPKGIARKGSSGKARSKKKKS